VPYRIRKRIRIRRIRIRIRRIRIRIKIKCLNLNLNLILSTLPILYPIEKMLSLGIRYGRIRSHLRYVNSKNYKSMTR